MRSNCKRSKAVRIIKEDRLSNLPIAIICHILSFLPTNDVVRTSVLSTMWRFLFLDVPNINISSDLRSKNTPGFGNFIDFVNEKILYCKTAPLTEFQLDCRFQEKCYVNLCPTTLLLSEFSYILSPRSSPGLCSPLDTLVILKLCGHGFILNIPMEIRFPKLKVLDYDSIKIDVESEILRFADEGYPVLEELRLKNVLFRCREKYKLEVCIFLCTLKILVISSFGFQVVRVDAPGLQQLEFIKTDYNAKVHFRKSESLVSTTVNFSPFQWNHEFFSKIDNVQKLCLSRCIAWGCNGPLPHFLNLTHLDLISTREKIIWRLLQHASNLEELVYDLELPSFCSGSTHAEEVPLCFAQSLREIKIRDFKFLKYEMKILKFLLRRGRVLERVIVEYGSHMDSALDQVQKLPRWSSRVRLVWSCKDEH